MLSIELRLCADDLVQQLDVGQTLTVVAVPVLDTGRKVITLEARYFAHTAVCSIVVELVI